jgi:hypothetical protein
VGGGVRRGRRAMGRGPLRVPPPREGCVCVARPRSAAPGAPAVAPCQPSHSHIHHNQ